MRQAYQDLQLIRNKTGKGLPIALSLGFDHCAEHEFGIGGIRSRLGMKDDADGIDRRRLDPERAGAFLKSLDVEATKTKPAFHILKSLASPREKIDLKFDAAGVNIPNPRYNKHGYTSLWDDRSFQIIAIDKEVIAFLKDFEAAVAAGNAAVMPLAISGDNPFSNSSLSLIIVDRLPKSVLDKLLHQDLDQRRLRAEFQASGIERELRETTMRFHVLSPKRITAEQKARLDTEYDFQLWLNADREKIGYGWYTVEGLRERIRSEFPRESQMPDLS